MKKILSLLKSLPVQLGFCLLFAFFLGSRLDETVVRFFYTLSFIFMDILLFILPLIIFIYIFCSVIGLDRRSPLFALLILGGVTLSNLFALFTAYGISFLVLPFFSLPPLESVVGHGESIKPLWTYTLPKCLGTDKALLFGFLSGMVLSFLPEEVIWKKSLIRASLWLRDGVTSVLQVFFIPLLPLYILGFCLKLSYEGSFSFLIDHYAQVFFLNGILVVFYLGFLYSLVGDFKRSKIIRLFKIMLPAGISGFSTMSSAAALPITLKGVEEITEDKSYSNFVVPSTSNIHMIGDDLTITLTAMALLGMKGTPFPDLISFSFFAGAFCFAKLSCVGIPGASVLVILPVLQQFLGFDGAMISILTTIYILQDSMGTFTNVMGNGAFALLLQKVFYKVGLLKKV